MLTPCFKVLAGGTTLLPGFASRIETELCKFPDYFKFFSESKDPPSEVKIIEPPHRRYMAWQGGSIVAEAQQDDESKWISRQDYEEMGASLALKKILDVDC